MTRPTSMPLPAPTAAHRRRRPGRPAALAAIAALVCGAALGAAAPVAASPESTPVTRAALEPMLVDGRGADVAFLEQEAENAVTDGELIGPDRTAYSLAAEASGCTAVQLTPGEHVEFTLPAATNAITVRYSIPDAPNGGGITAPLAVSVDGGAS